MNENAFIAALQDINNHPVRFGECTITFTFHDGRLQYYTLTTSERKNVADINTGYKKWRTGRMEKLHEETKASSHFYILIPSEVITNSELTDGAKLLYGEILFLSSKKDYCFATNDYFAKLNSVSKRTVNNWLLELRKAGLVSSEIVRNAFNRQVEDRKLFIKRDYSIQAQVCKENTSPYKNDGPRKLIFGKHKNVFLTESEKSELLQNCTETILNQEMDSYSVWKKENNAKPKSDFETLRKWLNQKRQKGAYKANITAVKETGIDEVSQKTLDNLPF